MSQEDLNYKGPDKTWDPPSGGNRPRYPIGTEVVDGYYDLAGLKDLLKEIIAASTKLINDCEDTLSDFNLKVQPETTLWEAHEAEWPSSLGEVKDYISYHEYRALENRTTRGANYIRSRYEDGARGEFGSNAIDVVSLAYNIKTEAENIQEFIDDYIGEVDDSAEKRTLELLQDWAENAIFHTGNLRGIIEKGEPETKISDAELDSLSPERASQYQAFFKIKVNALNNEIAQIQAEAKKENVTLSNVYFRKFLGPALKFRLNSTRGLEREAGPNGILAQEASMARNTINANFSVTLSDQIRRNTSFEEKQLHLQGLIEQRDKYTGFIKQLSTKGVNPESEFVDVEVPPEEREEFKAQTLNNDVTTTRFKSIHGDLTGVDDDDAHTQYLLLSGGTITGDVSMSDGVTIDGVDPSAHRHTGADGTLKVRGSDIEGRTIGNDQIDDEDKPETPTNLTLDSLLIKTIPPGLTKVDAVVSWEGPANCTFEFQIARLS